MLFALNGNQPRISQIEKIHERMNLFPQYSPSKMSTLPENHSLAAETIVSNVDLLTELLLRVPAKPLIKFKCVSKYWLSLISDPQFGSNHTRRNPNPPVSGIYLHNSCPRSDNLPINDRVKPVSVGGGTNLPTFSFLHVAMSGSSNSKVSHSSNGLMLCCYGDGRYIICNLTTQKFRALPSVTRSEGYSPFEPYLIFDPTKSPYYKVVCVSCCYFRNASQLAIYTSQFASWKYVSLKSFKEFGRGVIWNGGIIWMSLSRRKHIYSRLDVNTEKLTVTRVPPNPNLSKGINYFEECGGRFLHIKLPAKNAMEFVVHEMDRDDFRWTEIYRVDLISSILGNSSRSRIAVISVVKGAKENDIAVVFYNWGKVFSINLECRTMKFLGELSRQERRNYEQPYQEIIKYEQPDLYQRFFQFLESLSPV